MNPALLQNLVKPVIITRSGKKLDLLYPDPEQIEALDIAHALAHLCRFTGHTKTFYSVAQHSILVAEQVPRSMAREALLHDAAEAYVGDVSTPLKLMLPEYQVIERRIQEAIQLRFGLCFSDENRLRIKQADTVLLATERRDFFEQSAQKEHWPLLDGILPLENTIHTLSPEQAYQTFSSRCAVLGIV